jgi:hypothetical protein
VITTSYSRCYPRLSDLKRMRKPWGGPPVGIVQIGQAVLVPVAGGVPIPIRHPAKLIFSGNEALILDRQIVNYGTVEVRRSISAYDDAVIDNEQQALWDIQGAYSINERGPLRQGFGFNNRGVILKASPGESTIELDVLVLPPLLARSEKRTAPSESRNSGSTPRRVLCLSV